MRDGAENRPGWARAGRDEFRPSVVLQAAYQPASAATRDGWLLGLLCPGYRRGRGRRDDCTLSAVRVRRQNRQGVGDARAPHCKE